MLFTPFGRVTITIDDRLGTGVGSAGAAIQAVWAMLATFFSASKNQQKIGYGPSSDLSRSTLGTTSRKSKQASVLLNADYFSKTVPLNDRRAAAIMHESLHALGFDHNKIDASYTVLNSNIPNVHDVPFLRLDDFWSLRRIFAFKNEVLLVGGKPTSDSVYSWQYQKESGWSTFNADQKIRTSTVTYLYDIVYDSTGINTLDFSKFTQNTLIDLRASGTLDNGHIDGTNVHGSLIVGFKRFGKYNIYNAPNAVLHNAFGGSAADQITGNQLNNSLVGNAGNDTLIGLAGDDTLDGGEGFDTADYSRDAGTHGVTVNLSSVFMSVDGHELAPGTALDGYDGHDTLVSIETIIGTSKDDIIWGSDAGVWLDGGAGNDELYGGAGNDTLIGGAGNDTINGCEGDDTMTGGDGADVFIYGLGYGNDLITDFNESTDHLWLRGNLTNGGDVFSYASDTSAGLVFDFGNGQRLTLAHVTKAALQAANGAILFDM